MTEIDKMVETFLECAGWLGTYPARREIEAGLLAVMDEHVAKSARAAEGLAVALREARDAVDDWAWYAGPYFREKHDLAGDLAKIDAALSIYEEAKK